MRIAPRLQFRHSPRDGPGRTTSFRLGALRAEMAQAIDSLLGADPVSILWMAEDWPADDLSPRFSPGRLMARVPGRISVEQVRIWKAVRVRVMHKARRKRRGKRV